MNVYLRLSPLLFPKRLSLLLSQSGHPAFSKTLVGHNLMSAQNNGPASNGCNSRTTAEVLSADMFERVEFEFRTPGECLNMLPVSDFIFCKKIPVSV